MREKKKLWEPPKRLPIIAFRSGKRAFGGGRAPTLFWEKRGMKKIAGKW